MVEEGAQQMLAPSTQDNFRVCPEAAHISKAADLLEDPYLLELHIMAQLTVPGSKTLNSSLLESTQTRVFMGSVRIGEVCPMSTFKSIGKVVS